MNGKIDDWKQRNTLLIGHFNADMRMCAHIVPLPSCTTISSAEKLGSSRANQNDNELSNPAARGDEHTHTHTQKTNERK